MLGENVIYSTIHFVRVRLEGVVSIVWVGKPPGITELHRLKEFLTLLSLLRATVEWPDEVSSEGCRAKFKHPHKMIKPRAKVDKSSWDFLRERKAVPDWEHKYWQLCIWNPVCCNLQIHTGSPHEF